MLPYFFLLLALATLYPNLRLTFDARAQGKVLSFSVWPALILMLVIGFRYNVGGDWFSYIGYLNRANDFELAELLSQGDPAYQLLNWIVAVVDAEIWLVNLLSATIFTYGLIRFVNSLPDPKLAMIVAIPYLVMVVAMGYQRQGIALGLVMVGLPHLFQRRILTYTLMVLFAATFHKSAIVMLPFAVLASARNRWILYPALLVTGYFAFDALVADALDNLVVNYVDAAYQSQGALVRVLMCVLPATIFLILRKRYSLVGFERIFWLLMSIGSVGALFALQVSDASTAIDRLALYLIPIQLFVFSGLPEAMSQNQNSSAHRLTRYVVILYSFIVMAVWLLFAGHRSAWVPYQIYPLFG